MNSLATKPAVATNVRFTEDELIVDLDDGRSLSVPIIWFPRLAKATTSERNHCELLGNGEGIHWPGLDEDISVAGLLAGKPSVEYRHS